VADAAEVYALLQARQGTCETLNVRRVRLQQVEGDALRTFRAHPGQPGELVDDVLEWTFEQLSGS
jgi:hypothetical protein